MSQIPACVGGKPVRAKPLAFYQPILGAAEKKAVLAVLDSGWITTGPAVAQFEKKLSQYTGAKQVLAVNSCTHGLSICLDALGVGTGDEVITTPLTFASTAHVIVHRGARPRLVDVDPNTLNIDPAAVSNAITRKTKAIIAVHLAGSPVDLSALKKIASNKKIALIEDAAHAFGAVYKGKPVGQNSDAAVYSFHAVKNLTTAEGGAIAVRSSRLAKRMRILMNNGLNRDAWNRFRGDGWRYQVTECGYKSNMSDVHAAIGLAQLKQFNSMQARRRAIVGAYKKSLSALPQLILPEEQKNTKHAWHVYLMRLRLDQLKIGRDQFIRALWKEGIHCNVHYIPVHLQPYYQKEWGYRVGDCPIAEREAASEVTLPLYPAMSDKDVQDVIKSVTKVVSYYAK